MTIKHCCDGIYCGLDHSPECPTLKDTNMTHPADALPLRYDDHPTFNQDGKGWSQEEMNAIRAARREGFELAMSEKAVPIGYVRASETLCVQQIHESLQDIWREANAVDTVIGRPDVLMSKLTALRDEVGQATNGYVPLASQPAQEKPSKCSICGGTGQVEQYTSANAPKVKVKCPFCAGDGKCRTPQSCVPHGCHGGCLPVEQQQAGAAEVSDEQIEKLAHRMCWQYRHSTDPHHSNTYKFNLMTLLDYSRATLALKATAGGVA